MGLQEERNLAERREGSSGEGGEERRRVGRGGYELFITEWADEPMVLIQVSD